MNESGNKRKEKSWRSAKGNDIHNNDEIYQVRHVSFAFV